MTDAPAPLAPLPAWIPEMPAIWPGYVIAVLFLGTEVWEIAGPGESNVSLSLLGLISLGGWIYWLRCVYVFHDVMAQIPGYDHPITPGWAVGMHFVPLYNFYWVFKWPSAIAAFVNWRTQSQVMKGWVPGLFVLIGVLILRLFDGALGFAALFTAGLYISRRLTMAFSAPPVPASAMAPPGTRGPLGL